MKLAAQFDERVSLRHNAVKKIENYLKIDIAPSTGGVKSKEIAERARAVPAPPEWKLSGYNDPDLKKHLGAFALKHLLVTNVECIANTQDRPRDIHRTILLNDPPVGPMQFDATRKPRLLLRCLADGAKSAIAFFKSNYILKQKIHELRAKKQQRVSYYQENNPERVRWADLSSQRNLDPMLEARDDATTDGSEMGDFAILRADLIMTGVIPDKLNMLEDRIKNRLADTGYLAYRMHVSLQDPHWLPAGTDKLEHIDEFLHFNIRNKVLPSEAGSFHPFIPCTFYGTARTPPSAKPEVDDGDPERESSESSGPVARVSDTVPDSDEE